MKPRFCGCKMCRVGMRCKRNSEMITKRIRAARRKAKVDLKKGKELETRAKIPYTG
mgnify:CR=1 FL=1